MIFTIGNRKFDLEGYISQMMKNYNFNATSMEQPNNKKFLLDFLHEMGYDIKQPVNKSARNKNLVQLINSSAIRAGSLKKSEAKRGCKRFLSSNLDEIRAGSKFLLEHKTGGENSNINNEELLLEQLKY